MAVSQDWCFRGCRRNFREAGGGSGGRSSASPLFVILPQRGVGSSCREGVRPEATSLLPSLACVTLDKRASFSFRNPGLDSPNRLRALALPTEHAELVFQRCQTAAAGGIRRCIEGKGTSSDMRSGCTLMGHPRTDEILECRRCEYDGCKWGCRRCAVRSGRT